MSNNEKFKNTVPYILIATLLASIGYLGFHFINISIKLEKLEKQGLQVRTDTVYVNKPYKVVEIQKEYIKVPYEVKVYQKDTALRANLEQKDIITNVNYSSGGFFKKPRLTVDKITPKGIVYSSVFNAPKIVGSLTIDYNGNACIRPKSKLDKRMKILGGTLTGAGISYFIFKVVQTSINNNKKI